MRVLPSGRSVKFGGFRQSLPGAEPVYSVTLTRDVAFLWVFANPAGGCVSPRFQAFERSRAFSFLLELKKRFTTVYGYRLHSALPYAMNSEFSPLMASEMVRDWLVGKKKCWAHCPENVSYCYYGKNNPNANQYRTMRAFFVFVQQ